MKKTTRTTIVRTILFLCLGALFGYTVTTVVKSSDKSSSIMQVIEDNCDCKEVNQIIYAKGVQFGTNGISTEKGEYQLVDCKFNSVKEEAAKIQELLKAKVKDFDQVDLLELEFINAEKTATIIFKNGKIQ